MRTRFQEGKAGRQTDRPRMGEITGNEYDRRGQKVEDMKMVVAAD